MDSQEWVCAGKFQDLEEDVGLRVQLPAGGKKDAVALFKHGGQLYALQDSCCHAGKSIHGGDIEDLGTVVVGKRGELGTGGLCVQCPRHQKKFAGGLYFNLASGKACTPEHTSKFRKLDSHRVKVHDAFVDPAGFVYVSAQPRRKHKPTAASVEAIVEDSSPNERRQRDSALAAAEPVQPSHKQLRGRVAVEQMYTCTLRRVHQVNRNAYIFDLGLPANSKLPSAPLSPIWHVTLRATIAGRHIERDYTPISTWSEWQSAGRLRLLIKIYPDGVMTQHLSSLGLGSAVCVSPPRTTLLVPSFLPPGRFVGAIASSCSIPRNLVLFAAGTGVVPMVQALTVALQPGMSLRTVTLLYSSKAPADLLCWEELQGLESRRAAAAEAVPEFRLWLAFSGDGGVVPEARWPLVQVIHRRFDAEAVAQALPDLFLNERIQVIVSGPEGFFGAVREAFPARLKEAAMFVDLDDE